MNDKRSTPLQDLSRSPSAVERELARLVRSVHDELFGGGAAPVSEKIRLSLELDLHLSSGRVAGEPLRAQVARCLQQAAARGDSYRPGRIHCHRCDSADCDHAHSPRPTAAFAGYSPTGHPEWRDFAQILLERKDPRVERVFADPPALVPLAQRGKELKGKLLRGFGRTSKSYDLLGQLAIGYFRGEGSGETGREFLFAVSVQAVETRYPGGRFRLVLNVIGTTAEGKSAAEWFEASGEHWFRGEISSARRQFAEIEQQVQLLRDAKRDGDSRLLGRIPAILEQLGRAVDQAGRQGERRTRHSQERRRDGRPTPAALEDVRSAPDESVYFDERRGTLIVLGPKGRAHAFTVDGRHVTSLRIDGDERERRIARERWKPAGADAVAALRAQLGRADRENDLILST